ncbi:probable transcription factor PosF21 [Vicia villosa]|uniref:probable transcription factor PosF21 n=1 Tax=Vicia villosa TaxID=3911 RepID=UPI00273ADBC3|nr:probable transcription factor PosF21 [Vicia villosa]
MDGSSTKNSKMLRVASKNVSKVDSRKPKFAIEGSKLALADPKRARRILTKRKIFKRLREKEFNRYIFNQEKRVAILQKKADHISAFNTKCIRNVLKLAAEVNELRLKMQTAMEVNCSQEVILNAMKEEKQRLIEDILRLRLLNELGPEYNDETMQTYLLAQQFQHDDEKGEEDGDDVMEDDGEDEDEVMEDDEEDEDE